MKTIGRRNSALLNISVTIRAECPFQRFYGFSKALNDLVGFVTKVLSVYLILFVPTAFKSMEKSHSLVQPANESSGEKWGMLEGTL